eukprot:TRINITY_DN796_c0_g1_i1.p1 TRINITY_DN796_c0_g1~~TRINITY_DN796_c0_g1_i1.p1  ORF type:complete len:269 (-),score=49.56 TRINITY_DN796_c0_g1_i1:98-904(-)
MDVASISRDLSNFHIDPARFSLEAIGNDCLSVILDFLEPKALLIVAQLNRRFYDLANNQGIWKKLLMRTFEVSEIDWPELPTNWKETYFRFRGFQFVRLEETLRLSNHNLTIEKTRTSSWASAVARKALGIGSHYWEVRVTHLQADKAIMIGVTNDKTTRYTGFYQQVSAWAYYSFTGEKYHAYKPERYFEPFTNGDVIGVELKVYETNTASIGFYKNGRYCGSAFQHLTGKMFWPFVDLYNLNNMVSVLPFRTRPPTKRTGSIKKFE